MPAYIGNLDPKNIEEIVALTPLQEGMLFHYLQDPGGEVYVEQLCLEIGGAVDLGMFERAWNVVIGANQMLRTVFRWEKVRNPVQIILKRTDFKYRYLDLSGEEDDCRGLPEVKDRDRHEGFDLRLVPFRVTLCRLAPDHYALFINHHHILYDGWSTGIILREFFGAYGDLCHNRPVKRSNKLRFRRWLEWLQARDRQPQQHYWQRYLSGIDSPAALSLKAPGKQVGSVKPPAPTVYRWPIPATLKARLKELGHCRGFTLAALLYAAWGLLLHRYSNSPKALFGITVSGRSAPLTGLESMVGLCINTIPLLVQAEPGDRLTEVLAGVQASLPEHEQYGTTPLVDIKQAARLEQGAELFDTLLAVENYPLDIPALTEDGPLKVAAYEMAEGSHYDLTVTFLEEAGTIAVSYIYSADRFNREAVQGLARHFNRVVEAIVHRPDRRVETIELLSPSEKRRLLALFNDTALPPPPQETIMQVWAERSQRSPHRLALVGREHGSGDLVQSTYRQLDRQVCGLAGWLQSKGVGPDTVVGLESERTVGMIVGILGILRAGGAYLPLDPAYPAERSRFMQADSGSKLLMDDRVLSHSSRPHRAFTPTSCGHPAHLAYVIYTSGSTGRPKGVAVNQGAVVNILFALQAAYPLDEGDAYLLKTSYVFDVSVTELFGWFFGCGRLWILAEGGEKDPARILTALERGRISHLNFVPPMFRVFLEALTAKKIKKLAGLKFIFLAGEALPPDLVEQFKRLGTGIALENLYGPTEATIYSSRCSLAKWNGGTVPIGRPLPNLGMYILDPYDRLSPPGTVGELCIAGVGLARSYLNNPELTADKFITAPATSPSHQPLNPKSQILYRTGDLVRLMPDGNIEFLGRIDHQVKIRGFRVELAEIEAALRRHPTVQDAVVTLSSGTNGDKTLTAYLISSGTNRTNVTNQLRQYLTRTLPPHMVPLHFIQLAQIPLTPSGKVDRRRLPAPDFPLTEGLPAPLTDREKKLTAIWSQVLSIDSRKIAADDDFFRLGGHSLSAIRLIGRLHREFFVQLSPADLFQAPTIRGLAEYIGRARQRSYAPIPPVEKREYYPLSPAQRSLFIWQQVNRRSTAYNMPACLLLAGRPEAGRWAGIFKTLIQRHESLRTAFLTVGGEPVQRVHDGLDFEIEPTAADTMPSFVRPFDLSRPPLLRLGIGHASQPGKYILMMDVHHIAADGASLRVLIREVSALFSGQELGGLRVQYKDFSAWQAGLMQSGQFRQQQAYWLSQWAGARPALNLPLDFPRPAAADFGGDTLRFSLTTEEAGRLKQLMQTVEATVFMGVLALLNVLLSRLSGTDDDDIVVGTAVEGRGHPDLEDTVGMFVNTLALRNHPSPSRRFLEFLEAVKGHFLEALENRDFPFETLVDRVDTGREPGQNPLFAVMLVIQDRPHRRFKLADAAVQLTDHEKKTAKFDMTWTVEEADTGLTIGVEYAASLFKRTTIERFGHCFRRILRAVSKQLEMKIGEIEIIGEAEKRLILHDFNEPAAHHPPAATIHGCFDSQADRAGDRAALVKENHCLTYRELAHRSLRLSRRLKAMGVGPAQVVGLMPRRSLEMVTAMLGILKAGAAYLPLDADYPRARIRFMLQDSQAAWLVTTAEDIFVAALSPGVEETQPHSSPAPANQLAYVIYTSGTSGRPKGVLVEHGSVVRLLFGDSRFDFGRGDVWTLFHSHCFDFSVWEQYGALLHGGKLIVIPTMLARDTPRFMEELKRQQVTVLNQTPSAFYQLVALESEVEKRELNLRCLIFGGEDLNPSRLQAWRERYPRTRLINMYGITETTVHVTYKEITAADMEGKSGTIGRAIANWYTYIMSPDLTLLPGGVPGEICVGGAGLARGYLNRVALTAERFVDDPYRPGRRLYRSGDQAVYLEDYGLRYLGRSDRQVQVRGFRVELAEIENQLTKHRSVKEAVVTVTQDPSGDQSMVAYLVPPPTNRTSRTNKTSPLKLREYLSRTLPPYMIPTYFVSLPQIPLTPNGKLDRRALPPPATGSRRDYTAPRSRSEKQLARLWSSILNLRQERIGIDDHFFELGGHSLKAVRLMTLIYRQFQVEVPLAEIFANPTIRGLAQFIEGAAAAPFVPIRAVEEREYYGLTSAQTRLYLLWQRQPESLNYHIGSRLLVEGRLDEERLERVCASLIRRHESLRTSFHWLGDEPVQKIHRQVAFGLEHQPDPRAFLRAFDLCRAPLLRVGIGQPSQEGRYVLMVDVHHIIADGLSLNILIKEFAALLTDDQASLPQLRLHYKDYSRWQRASLGGENMARQQEFWLQELGRELPVLHLPVDAPVSTTPAAGGTSRTFCPDDAVAEALKQLAAAQEVTPYALLLCLFHLLLARLSGQAEIVTGTPVSGRTHRDVQPVVGMFVNTLVLRQFPEPDKMFLTFLREAAAGTIRAFDNQDYPFDLLVERLGVSGDNRRNPLFNVMFSWQQGETVAMETAGLKMRPLAYDDGTGKFDLSLRAALAGNRLSFIFVYSTALFHSQTIDRFIAYFNRIVAAVLENPGQRIGEIDMIPAAERHRLLTAFNDTVVDYPRAKTLHELFGLQAQKTPDWLAGVGPDCRAGDNCVQLSYRELAWRCRSLACWLRTRGVQTGSLAALMLGRHIDRIVAMMAVLESGGAYLPIDPQSPRERIRFMLRDSHTRIVITDRWLSRVNQISSPPVRLTSPTQPHSADPAYVIYTSGSTGRPKGVLVAHRSLVNVVTWFGRTYGLTGGVRVLQLTDYTFDASINQIFGTLVHGAALYMPPQPLTADVERLYRYIERHRLHLIYFVPYLLRQLLLGRQRLTSVEAVIFGGEQLDDALKAQLLTAGYRLYNQYGPTETTVDALMEPCSTDRVTLGRPIANTNCYVTDDRLRLLPIGVWGELVVAGTGVSRGYLNNPELTAQKFINAAAKGREDTRSPQNTKSQILNPKSQILYRTGDLARFLPDGKIEFAGRLDHQVKIRGHRIELAEIEAHLRRHPDILDVVVTARQDQPGDRYLTAYLIPQTNQTSRTKFRHYLAGTLPDYMIPAHFVYLDELPRTQTGKIDRQALPVPEVSAGITGAAPSNEREVRLLKIWSEVLGIETDRLGVDSGFFELGGHSLKAAVLTSRIGQAFGVAFPIAGVFDHPTIRAQARWLGRADRIQYRQIKAVEKREYYPQSSAQRRLFLLDRFEEVGTAYNMPAVLRVEGALEVERCRQAFRALIRRHDSLRTALTLVHEEPVQVVHDAVDFEIEYYDMAAFEEAITGFIRPFDLSRAPLFRVGLIRQDKSYTLMVDMHHAVTDGASIALLVREWLSLYQGEPLPGLPLRCCDYAHWQQGQEYKMAAAREKAYWQGQFTDVIPVLELPTDFARPVVQSFQGDSPRFCLDPQIQAQLESLGQQEGVTLFMLLLSVFNVLLSKLSGQEDLVVGTPVAGRRRAELQSMVGMFVNTLALRNRPLAEKGFREFLQEVKERSLEGFENQDYPFEELVETLDVNRDTGRNPLFDVMLVVQNMEMPILEAPGLRLIPCECERGTARFDLGVTVSAGEEGLAFRWEYGTCLFRRETIDRYWAYFERIAAAVTADPDIKIGDIEVISTAERQTLLFDFNDTAAGYPAERTLHGLFEEQVEQVPDRTALVFNDRMLSYRAVDRQSDRLAGYLESRGIRPQDIVGLLAERSPEMVIAILGILKAGAAYLPLDPGYPPGRRQLMLADSGARVLLDDHSLGQVTGSGGEHCAVTQPAQPDPPNPAYVIYTSGSTGRPKGVLVAHRSVVNVLTALQAAYPLEAADVYLLKTAYVFDVSVAELFGWFFGSGRLSILPVGAEKAPAEIVETVKRQRVSHINFVPSMFRTFLEVLDHEVLRRLTSLKYIFLAGEALTPDLVEAFKACGTSIPLENLYGPSEATVYVSRYSLTHWPGAAPVPIGRPLSNTALYVITPHGRLSPPGTVGELCIAGVGLARGYLNNPELSADKFINLAAKAREDTRSPNHEILTPKSQILYRTGDLARFLPDGNLEFLGRIDHQVKVRGFRIELAEIEAHLLRHRHIGAAVVVAREDKHQEKYLTAYLVPQTNRTSRTSPAKLRQYLSRTLPDYMIPAHFIFLEQIPLTAAGKVDRQALPRVDRETHEAITPPRDHLERTLLHLWSQTLHIEPGKLGIDSHFFRLGGHSLRAVRLIAAIHKNLDVKIPLAGIFKNPSIRQLARQIRRTQRNRYAAVPPIEKREYYPVSSAQKRMFILQQMKGDDTSDNTPAAVWLEGGLDRQHLTRVIQALIQRHEPLRTGFEVRGGEPVQRVYEYDTVEFAVETSTPANQAPEALIRQFIRAFDLSHPPLLRVGLIEWSASRHIMLYDMHHIIRDGSSSVIFIEEFVRLYRREALSPLKIQYKDFALWQNSQQHTPMVQRQEAYWLEVFSGQIPVLNLPTDFPRPAVQSFEGRVVRFSLDSRLSQDIYRLAAAGGATLYMVLLAGLNILLSRYSGQEDIVVGTPVAGRPHDDLKNLIGMFVNTLALRNHPLKQKRFSGFLEEVKSHCLAAFDNQDYQFEELVARLGVEPDPARQPLFDVMLVVQNVETDRTRPDIRIGDLRIRPYRFSHGVSQFDMMIHVFEKAGKIAFDFRYCSRLFRADTIRRFIDNFKEVMGAVTRDSDIPLEDIKISHGFCDRQIAIPRSDFVFS
jgi:tyrocidine synthetase-3